MIINYNTENLAVLNWILSFYLNWELSYKWNNYYIKYVNYYSTYIKYFVNKLNLIYSLGYVIIYTYIFNSLLSIYYFKFAEFIWILYIQKYALYLYKSNNNVNTLIWHFQKYFN